MAHGRLFFTLEALGKENELHQAVFEEIQGPTAAQDHTHSEGGLFDLASILRFAEAHGISRADFQNAWNSPEVSENIERALAFTNNLNIKSVPALAVNGRYSFAISRKGEGFFLATAEYLIKKEQAEAAAKSQGG